jgi:hypothetical protein
MQDSLPRHHSDPNDSGCCDDVRVQWGYVRAPVSSFCFSVLECHLGQRSTASASQARPRVTNSVGSEDGKRRGIAQQPLASEPAENRAAPRVLLGHPHIPCCLPSYSPRQQLLLRPHRLVLDGPITLAVSTNEESVSLWSFDSVVSSSHALGLLSFRRWKEEEVSGCLSRSLSLSLLRAPTA